MPHPLVQGKRLDQEGEVFLYCQSSGRAKKEESIKTLFQQRFEDGLKAIADSLTKKRGTKGNSSLLWLFLPAPQPQGSIREADVVTLHNPHSARGCFPLSEECAGT